MVVSLSLVMVGMVDWPCYGKMKMLFGWMFFQTTKLML